jgi:hypothetical protein
LSRGLRDLSGCSDPDALTAAYPIPEDAEIRSKIDELRDC